MTAAETERVVQRHRGLLGKWQHFYRPGELVAYCGHRRNRTGHWPSACPTCPTCEFFSARRLRKGVWN